MWSKHSPHHYTTTSLDCWHKAGRVHGFMLLMPNSDPTICSLSRNRFIRPGLFSQSSSVQCWWVCVTAASDFCSWLSDVEPDLLSAAVDGLFRMAQSVCPELLYMHCSCKECVWFTVSCNLESGANNHASVKNWVYIFPYSALDLDLHDFVNCTAFTWLVG